MKGPGAVGELAVVWNRPTSPQPDKATLRHSQTGAAQSRRLILVPCRPAHPDTVISRFDAS